MAGSKRTKLKKLVSPNSTPDPVPSVEDDGLVEDLLATLESRDPSTNVEAANVLTEVQVNAEEELEGKKKKDSKSRFKEREARKAAALAASQPANDPAQTERIERETKYEAASIKQTCERLGLEIHEITPDGHCLFSAVADQLSLLSILPPSADYRTTRLAAATYMYQHPDDFLPFLPSLTGEDGAGATASTGLLNPRDFSSYCATVRDTGVWGGEPEIMALSRAYQVPIHIVQSGPPPVVVHSPSQGGNEDPFTASDPIIRISYHRRMYGLGEHYNSLRPKSRLHSAIDSILH